MPALLGIHGGQPPFEIAVPTEQNPPNHW